MKIDKEIENREPTATFFMEDFSFDAFDGAEDHITYTKTQPAPGTENIQLLTFNLNSKLYNIQVNDILLIQSKLDGSPIQTKIKIVNITYTEELRYELHAVNSWGMTTSFFLSWVQSVYSEEVKGINP